MTLSLNSKRTPPPPRRGTFNHRFTIIGPLLAAFVSALLLTACPDPGGTGTSTSGTNGTNPEGGSGKDPAPTTYTTTITGTVQHASPTGAVGLPGAAVSASTKPEPTTTTTGPNGAFTLTVTHSGTLPLTLTAQKACYEPSAPQNITLSKDTTYNADAIPLTLGPEPQDDNRFTLDRNPGSTDANPTYTLTIADCVRTVTPGEFLAGGLITTLDDANSRIAALLGPSSRRNDKVTAIELPDTLRTIGRNAFHGHRAVTGEFTIPVAVESIGFAAFRYFGHIGRPSLRFAQNSRLKTIGARAFNDAKISAMQPLPPSLETVGPMAFQNAFTLAAGPSLSNFVIPENVTSVGNNAFGSRGFSGTLTIRSTRLTRTPALDPPNEPGARTGRLGSSIFREAGFTLIQKFTKIVIPRSVFITYTQADLNAIFGPSSSSSVTYVDLADGTTTLDITTLTP